MALNPALRAAADAAYDRRDQEWFNNQSTEDLKALWEVACDIVNAGAAWDDEVFDALAIRGYFDEPKPAPFVFDKNYNNHEQVRPYLADFLRVYAEIEATGAYTYNDSFKGRIPGIEGPDEDTAIYLLQTLKRLDELAVQVEKFLADGGREVTADEVGDKVLRGTVVFYGFYMGGTGWKQYDKARLLRRRYGNGELGSLCVLPKGKRTHGHLAEGTVLLKEE